MSWLGLRAWDTCEVVVATLVILIAAIARIDLEWIWDLGLGTPCEPALNLCVPHVDYMKSCER